MPNIIEPGKYPEKNKRRCEDCNCYFEYYNEEVVVETSTPLEEDTFGGYGVHKYIVCPECKHKNTILCEFYEYPSIFDEIGEFFKKLFKKKKGSKNNE